MRIWALVLVAAGCGKDSGNAPPRRDPAAPKDASAVVAPPDGPAAPPARPASTKSYPDLGSALVATIPADARVVGFGELHMRTDRKQVTSTLTHFTRDALPALTGKLSDLVIETWIPDPTCGAKAQTATAKTEITVKRPQETKSEIAMLAEAARAANVQPHAMKIGCDDYDTFAPKDGQVDPAALLSLTTRELSRIAGQAVAHRTKTGEKRPWIALYGGALHNDRFPAAGVEDWSYAPKVDQLTSNHYVEVDLLVPELAEADDAQKRQPYYGIIATADDKVHVYERGERSFVIVLPKGP